MYEIELHIMRGPTMSFGLFEKQSSAEALLVQNGFCLRGRQWHLMYKNTRVAIALVNPSALKDPGEFAPALADIAA